MITRPIKFRVPTKCQNGHFRWLLIERDGFGDLRPKWKDGLKPPCDCPTHEFNEGFAQCGSLQQFTGLLDNNDKPIYEGDLIRNTYEIPEFDCDEGRLGSTIKSEIVEVSWDSHWAKFTLTGQPYRGSFEVIGNIYENSELMKENSNVETK